jgi:putative phosphoesterase
MDLKTAFISDIHGNDLALNAVLADLKEKEIDQILVLGDLVFRGPNPKKTIDKLRKLDAIIIKGNTDEWVVRGILPNEVPEKDLEIMYRERDWCVNQLTTEDIDYLSGLPLDVKLHLSKNVHIHVFHATPDDLFEVLPPDANTEVFQRKLMKDKDATIYVYAHTHHPLVRYISGKCVINPGAVGYTFDGLAKSSYVLVEAKNDSYSVTVERVPFDIEAVVQAYYTNNYPNPVLMANVVRKAVHPFLVMS